MTKIVVGNANIRKDMFMVAIVECDYFKVEWLSGLRRVILMLVL